jgi:hypothetical protein
MTELFWLLVGHAVADFVLQNEVMAKGKNRNVRGTAPPGQTYMPCWPYWLTAHALVHGGAVALATGSTALGCAETVAHWVIDFYKCEGCYGVHADQGMHIGCKALWWVL